MKTQQGLTLIEMLVAIAVFAIIVSFAMPNLLDFIANNRLVSQTNELVSSLNFARSESVKRRANITVCGSTDGASCNTSSWERGWITFVDTNANGAVDSGEELLQVHSAIGGSNTVRSVSFSSTAYITYNSRGASASDGTFKICDSRGNKFAKAVSIALTGRSSRATDSNNNSIPNDVDGSDVACP